MTYQALSYPEQRRLAVLGYTENPQADGTCCPYVSLPRDYFGKAHYAHRVERVSYWMPRLMAALGANSQAAPAPKARVFHTADHLYSAWEVEV